MTSPRFPVFADEPFYFNIGVEVGDGEVPPYEERSDDHFNSGKRL